MSHAGWVGHEYIQSMMTSEKSGLCDLLRITQMGRQREEIKFFRTLFKDLNKEVLSFLFYVSS